MPSLLPNAKAQFVDANGLPLVGGTVGYYSPGTLNPLPTYQDQAGTIANTNPISLDSRGQAIIWGSGIFRQIVKDVFGVTIWDQIVASADSAFTGNSGASLIGFDSTNLANILTTRLNRVVDSIAALRSLSKVLYTRAFVTGYYAPHDLGGGAYQYDPADTTSADNGGTVIVATDGGRWKLMHDGTVSVCQFGARGTSVVGTLVDDTAAFQAAIATGLAIVIPKPPTYFRLTNAVNCTTAGQMIYGQGKDISIVQCDTAFNMSASGLFVCTVANGGEGPQFSDFQVNYVQPDTATRAALTTYPVTFYAQSCNRATWTNMKVQQASYIIDIRNNPGGNNIVGCEFSWYNIGINIDGAVDSIKIDRCHFWPFSMTSSQLTIFYDANCIAINTGRCDDLHVDTCLFISGQQIVAYQSSLGATFGNVSNCDFDTNIGIRIGAGSLDLASCYFSNGFAATQAIIMTGGSIAGTGCRFAVGVTLSQAQVSIQGGSANFVLSSSYFELGTADFSAIAMAAATTVALSNVFFDRAANITPANPTINQLGGQLTVVGCRTSVKGTGVGNFLSLSTDDFHIIKNNAFNGWGLLVPAVFSLIACDNNTGILQGDFVSTYCVGNIKTKVIYGVLTSGGAITTPHGIPAGHQKLINAIGFYRGSSGQDIQMAFSSMDGTNISFTSAGASVACRITIQYTETQQGW